MIREPRKSLLRAAAGTVLVVAALLMSQGTALAKVTFRTVGSASDADHLIRRSPADERVDHESLRGAVTRTASEGRHLEAPVKSAREIGSISGSAASRNRFRTVR